MLSARLWNSSLPEAMNPTSESSAPLKAFANARSVAVGRVVALGHVVLQEPRGAVGPRLARAERAVVRVLHRPGVGRLIDRARLAAARSASAISAACSSVAVRVRSMTERPSSMSRWRAWSACCSSNSAPASCSTSRRCCAVASAESRLSAWATNRSRSVWASASRSASRLATTRSLAAPDLLGGLDLLGPQLRELRVAHRRRLRDQLVDLLGVAAVPGPQRLDLGNPALVLGDDPRAALVRDAEERALELARDPLQVLGPVLARPRCRRERVLMLEPAPRCPAAPRGTRSGPGSDRGRGAAPRACVSSALICAVSRKVVKPSVGDSRSSWIRASSFSIVELARSSS